MNFGKYVNNEEFENKEFELKEIVSHKNYEKWLKEVNAFSNTNGGKIFFGVDDDENMIGLTKEQVKIDILYINEICDKKLHPRVNFEFNKIKIEEDKFIIEMSVKQNDNLPVWMMRSDEQDVVYIRKDGQSVLAQGDQLEKLILSSKRIPYDKTISPFRYEEMSFKNLNSLFYEKNDKDETITLKKLKSIEAVTDSDYITNGLYLFSDDYNNKNCNVACRIWPGISKGSSIMLDKKEFYGNIPKLLEFSLNYISMYTKNGLRKLDNGGHIRMESYPKRAIEEALINAIAHRDYYIDGSQIDIDIFANRIQITSPGSFLLPGNAQDYSLENIPSRRRNEIICEIFTKCKLMEKSGTGFDKIVEEYHNEKKEYQPKVYSDPAQFIITLYDLTYENYGEVKGEIKKTFSFKSPRSGNREYDHKILEYCLKEPKTRIEIQNYVELKNKSYFIDRILNPLLDVELLLPTQNSIHAPNQKYFTNQEKIKYEEN